VDGWNNQNNAKVIEYYYKLIFNLPQMPNLLWRTHPRKFGKDSRECRRCKCQIGLVRKYDLLLCRKCFRENGEIIGFTRTR
jgi:small subunit ribosomal protein S29e